MSLVSINFTYILMVYIYLFFVLFCIFTSGQSYPMYLLCLFSDFHSFNYHIYSHPTSLAF